MDAAQALRLWRTARHLKPVQIYGRLWFRLARPRPDLSAPPPLRSVSGPWQPPARRQPSLTGPGMFLFLNEAGGLDDHGWDDPARPKLWRYNQHYFDDLNAQGACQRTDWHRALIADWIAANPPGKGTGWEPYPTSLRIINWVKWATAGNVLTEESTQSLAIQTRWLTRRMEWHLLGNHLFGNAKALVCAGLHFEGPEAARWLKSGLSILAREIPEQILPDGGQFELSPMYHSIAVEDMLDLINIARVYGRADLADGWSARVPAMLDWLITMCHPDDDVAFFNDTAIGISPATGEILDYAVRLGFAPPAYAGEIRHLPYSGYARLTAGSAVLLADLARIGPDYLPGHAHADTLSFELSLHGRRVIVNSGTSVYGLGPERLRQRGTAAHSTLMIDRQDSSEVWSGFRVGRRARPYDVNVRRDGVALVAEGAHDGYRHLRGAPIHRRRWQLEEDSLVVIDAVEGNGRHQIEMRFHLAPGLQAVVGSDGAIKVKDAQGCSILALATTGGAAEVAPSSWHPQFGISLPSQVIRIHATADLPTSLQTNLHWS
jgi:uncharacterized heparinase superfamily protein